MESKNIHVFIVENAELAETLIRDHFSNHNITYAAIFNDKERGAITAALDAVCSPTTSTNEEGTNQ